MLQLYFLLVLLNLLAGLSLASDFMGEKLPSTAPLFKLISSPGIRGLLGILAFLVGFFSLIIVLPGDVPVVGDLLPAISALFTGTGLVLEYYQSKTTTQTNLVEKLDGFLLKNKTFFGLLAIILGVLHFILPTVMFI